ncbi:hypothetical protein HDU85_006390 [Gaertneriomyces sp. JEL0708]|nr:hypothetical protein HDU85_006390 [Gaertneriomyces sp. JEL0708]
MMATPEFDVAALESAGQEYLEKHSIGVYVEDAISRLLADRPAKPYKFLSDYFDSVLRGTNTILREYEYVKACRRNRLTFIKRLSESLNHSAGPFSATEFHHLVELVCPDFPGALVEKGVEIARRRALKDHRLNDEQRLRGKEFKVGCSDFVKGLAFAFSYFEFLEVFEHVLHDALAAAQFPDSRDDVLVPNLNRMLQDAINGMDGQVRRIYEMVAAV